jgi:hypothetical protein
MIDFHDPCYLAEGNRRQREVCHILSELHILEVLRRHRPVVAGTIPIDVDVENSDIDILCEYTSSGEFEQILRQYFSRQKDFRFKRTRSRGEESLVASFDYKGYKIEIFGQIRAPEEQDGFVHMIVEYRILRLCSSRFREEVRRLKREGLGTEPAFARLLGINTDPYETLRGFKELDDGELAAHIPDEHLRR